MGRCPQHLPFAKVPLAVCHETSSSVTKQSFLKTLFTPEEFENAGFVAGRTVDISGNDSLHTKKDNSLRCFLVSFIIQWGPPHGEFPGDFPQGPSPGTFQFPIKSGDNTARFRAAITRVIEAQSSLIIQGSSGACVSRLRFQLQCRNSYTLCCG